MSRAKMVDICKKKIDRELNSRNMSQKELAEHLGITPEHLNRSLKNGRITEDILDEIGILFDLAPEYLSDDAFAIPGAPINYASRKLYYEHNSAATIIRIIWIRNGYDPKTVDRDSYWGLYEAIKPVIDQYIDSYREKQKLLPPRCPDNTNAEG